MPLETTKFLKKSYRWGVSDPPPCLDHIARGRYMHRHVLGRGIAKRGWMHKAHMRRINQIFDDVQIMALQMQMSAVVHMPIP